MAGATPELACTWISISALFRANPHASTLPLIHNICSMKQ